MKKNEKAPPFEKSDPFDGSLRILQRGKEMGGSSIQQNETMLQIIRMYQKIETNYLSCVIMFFFQRVILFVVSLNTIIPC